MRRIIYVLMLTALLPFSCGEAPKEAPKSEAPAKETVAPPAEAASENSQSTDEVRTAADAVVIKDSDGDGVPDESDQCAETAAGAAVRADGCMQDQDEDGVADNQDACPGSPKSQPVDDRGCPQRLKAAREFQLDISFASGAASVEPGLAMAALAEPLRLARTYPNSQVRIYAYTDSSGSSAANQTLSQKRAESVAEIAVTQGGIAHSRVKAIGRGEADPVASNDTRAGRAANRRIVVMVLPGGAS